MNSFNAQLLTATIWVPLAAALLLACGLPKAVSRIIAFIGFAFPAIVALWLWKSFASASGAEYQYVSDTNTGLASLGISLHLGLNGISMPMFLLAGLVGLAAGLYALQSEAERPTLYWLLLLVMHGGLMGVFSSINIFFFYFFHELALIPTFIMVGIWGGRDRNYAAMKLTIYLTVGAMLSLLGLIALAVKSGATNYDLPTLREIFNNAPMGFASQKRIFGLLLFGFGILVSLWPLHTWAPLGYGAAPTSAAMLHAGVLKKFGLYGLIQIAVPLLPAGAAHWSTALSWLALGNVVIIGFVTMGQRNLKQLIGYGSVMHMGYCFLGIACLTQAGVGGAVMLMFAHGLSVALLFMLSTCVYHRTQTFEMSDMGGLAQKAPVLAAFFATATFASAGLPGLANFWGELTIFVSLWNFSHWVCAAAVSGVVISAIYGLRAVAQVFFGPPSGTFAKNSAEKPVIDLRVTERIPALLLIAALLWIGFYPRAISEPINSALQTSSWLARK